MEQQSNFVPNLTLGYGAFLIAWGIVVSILSDSTSFTSYIPSMLGAPLALAGVMVMRMPEKRKLWMHIAATFGLLCAIGGTRFFMVMGDGITYASGSMLMLLVTGSAYTVVCVRSFIAARKAREAAEASA
jgi:peptidoglycan/LPS O-acetylase OafA/YrhL